MKEQEVSLIYLPIELNKQNIEMGINQMIKGVIYEDNKMDGDGVMLKAEKVNLIKVSFKNNVLHYRVPLAIWVKKDISLTEVEVKGSIALNFTSKYTIGEDWSLKTETEVNDFEWIEKPKIKLALFDIPVKYIANKILDRSKEFIGNSIDQQVAQSFNLREYAEESWRLLQTPLLVSKDFNLWVKVNPKVLSVAPLRFDESKISSKIFIVAKTNAILGEKPASQQLFELPDFQFKETESDHFKVQAGTKIYLKEAERFAQKHLIGKSYSSGRRSVVVEDIDLSTQDGKLIVNAQLKGSYNGGIRMIGKPIYNKNDNQIEFEDLNYELNTKNVLMKSIGWIFQRRIENQFEKVLQFPLEENLKKTKKLINDRLQNYKVSTNVIVNGQIEEFKVGGIQIVNDQIKIIVLAEGKLKVELKLGT